MTKAFVKPETKDEKKTPEKKADEAKPAVKRKTNDERQEARYGKRA